MNEISITSKCTLAAASVITDNHTALCQSHFIPPELLWFAPHVISPLNWFLPNAQLLRGHGRGRALGC
jgi:hypothetical protein